MTGVLLVLASAAFAESDDAHALLAKAHAAYLENRDRERYWNWTTTTTRTIIDRDGTALQHIPSVTVESPIRSDGKRCNAVLAWGDGLQPYLASASADQRCAVEEEVNEPFQVEALLEARQVKIAHRTQSGIVVALRADRSLQDSTDRLQRCIASLEGTIGLDAATMFPKHISLKVAASGCEQTMPVVNHYDGVPVRSAASTLRKGAVLEREYELQKDKTGNASKDHWVCVRAHSVRPLREGSGALIVWGRRIPLDDSVRDRHIVVDGLTTASELTAESVLRMESEVKKDK